VLIKYCERIYEDEFFLVIPTTMMEHCLPPNYYEASQRKLPLVFCSAHMWTLVIVNIPSRFNYTFIN